MTTSEVVGTCQCGQKIFANHIDPHCNNCFNSLPEGITSLLTIREATRPVAPASPVIDDGETGKTQFLKILAWLNLIGSLIVALYIWIQMGTVESSGRFSVEKTNPVAVFFIIVTLAEGVIGCVFLLVVAETAEYVLRSYNLLKKAQQNN